MVYVDIEFFVVVVFIVVDRENWVEWVVDV